MKTKLRDWCRANDVSIITARRWINEGRFPYPIEQLGPRIRLVVEPEPEASGKTVIYARVSTSGQSDSLEKQASTVGEWAAVNNFEIAEVVTEVASGLNDSRKKWNRILADPAITTIIVKHRDRACRFGFAQLQASLKAHGRQIIVIDPTEIEDDLVRDLTEVLTSMCARLYGKRGAQARAKKAVEVVSQND